MVSKYYRLSALTVIAWCTASAVMAAELEPDVTLNLPDAVPAASAVVAAPAAHYELVEPLFVRALTQNEAGRNDSNPVWAPTGKLVAFERSRGDKREIVVSQPDGKLLQTIYFQLSGTDSARKEVQAFLPGLTEDPSYNSGISWARDSKRIAFMSNGGEGNYDIYSQLLGGAVKRLTDHKEKDGLADWSPTTNQVVFVSGRSGKGDIYLLNPDTLAVSQLTWGDKPYLYPRWSPDGKKIAMIYGSTENHNIFVIDDPVKPVKSMRALTSWQYDNLRPIWSPNGKKVAFYTNYNAAGEQKKWSLVVVAADGSDGVQDEKLMAQIVATDVVPDIEQGPAWLTDSSGLVYVKDDALEYNPIFIVDVASKKSKQLKTETKMNHDIACNAEGLILFRAQQDQWDQIFIAKLPN